VSGHGRINKVLHIKHSNTEDKFLIRERCFGSGHAM